MIGGIFHTLYTVSKAINTTVDLITVVIFSLFVISYELDDHDENSLLYVCHVCN